MRKILCLFVLVSVFIWGCSLAKKKIRYDDLPVKKITVTLNKTTQEDVISVWGTPHSTRNNVLEKYVETEVHYFYLESGGMLVVNVCNERNQCADDGKKTNVMFRFRDNKLVYVSEHLHPEECL